MLPSSRLDLVVSDSFKVENLLYYFSKNFITLLYYKVCGACKLSVNSFTSYYSHC